MKLMITCSLLFLSWVCSAQSTPPSELRLYVQPLHPISLDSVVIDSNFQSASLLQPTDSVHYITTFRITSIGTVSQLHVQLGDAPQSSNLANISMPLDDATSLTPEQSYRRTGSRFHLDLGPHLYADSLYLQVFYKDATNTYSDTTEYLLIP